MCLGEYYPRDTQRGLPFFRWKFPFTKVVEFDGVCGRATGAERLAGTADAARIPLYGILEGFPAVKMMNKSWIEEGAVQLCCTSNVIAASEAIEKPGNCPGLIQAVSCAV